MALIHSASLELGKTLEHFELEDPNGEIFKSKDLFGKGGFIIAVMCNHCPYSNAIWKRLNAVAEFAKKLDITAVAINPNIHPNYPEDSPSHMLDKIKEMGIEFLISLMSTKWLLKVWVPFVLQISFYLMRKKSFIIMDAWMIIGKMHVALKKKILERRSCFYLANKKLLKFSIHHKDVL